ncbi:SDR family NAD(P)-dependent oxidoreductase [Novosphingobium bradum]|uniref:SDR family NAD(P)-dependent oxidoreductase n=1 Tax=Novosphingobium bradum TaxID=1737444 RepID=A0ABV7IQ82_9SPHN
MTNGDLSGKVAIVTGAGGGIGSVTAERLARAGAKVLLTDINPQALDAATSRLAAEGLAVRQFVADVAQESDVAALVADVIGAWGQIDVVHNNAAIVDYQDRSILDLSVEVWDRTIAINSRGPMLLCKHVLPHMIARGQGGSIINATSHASENGQAEAMVAYGSSKGALNSLTYYVATQMAPHRIRCNGIMLGVVATEGLRQLLGDERMDWLSANAQLGRTFGPADVAPIVHFLASDEAELITGKIFRV